MSTDNYSMGGQIGGGQIGGGQIGGGQIGGGQVGGGQVGGSQVGASFGSSMSGGLDGGFGGGAGGDGLIKDATTESFMQDVMEASRSQPVLVDFWAPWCGPCKQLTPVIEGAVKAAGGAVKLVKMNIDENPEIAGQLGIQSIPAVIVFKDGQPVDGFMGAKTDSEVKAFIEKLGGAAPVSQTDALLEQGDAFVAEKDWGQAAQMFGAVMQAEPDNVRAICGLAQCYLGADDTGRAKQALEMVPEDQHGDPAYIAVKAAVELAEQAEALGDLAELQARIEKDPLDHQARFDLALGLNGKGAKNEAVDQLIEIIRQDRDWNEDGGRKQLLLFFEAWGGKEPATNYGRRKLSAVLFS